MIVCEICGSRLTKHGDVFVCNGCGLEYSVEDVRNMAGVSVPEKAPDSGTLPTDAAPAEINGGREKLIAFLSAMFDATFAVECCDEEIKILEENRNGYPLNHRYVPRPFTEVPPELDDKIEERAREKLQQQKEWLRERRINAVPDFFLTMVADNPVSAVRESIWDRKDNKKRVEEIRRLEQELALAPARQNEENLRYLNEYTTYKQHETAHNEAEKQREALIEAENAAVLHSYDEAIAEVQKKKEEFSGFVRSINKDRILYEGYENSVAIMQLREYLIMGVCTGLEGPQGAYAFYLDELHANRICGSVNELQNAMTKGINEILGNMRSMLQQLRRLNSRISSLKTEISDGITTLSGKFDEYEKSVGSGISTMTRTLKDALDENCKSIGDVVKRSAYNQYLEMQRERLGDYSYGHEYYPGLMD